MVSLFVPRIEALPDIDDNPVWMMSSLGLFLRALDTPAPGAPGRSSPSIRLLANVKRLYVSARKPRRGGGIGWRDWDYSDLYNSHALYTHL